MIEIESASIGVNLRLHILYVPLRPLRLSLGYVHVHSMLPALFTYMKAIVTWRMWMEILKKICA
jgi:hypothetical protein